MRRLQFPPAGNGELIAVWEDESGHEIRINEDSLVQRISNLQKQEIGTSQDSAILAELRTRKACLR